MFVSTKSFRSNPKLYFFNDKELSAKGSKSERLAHQFLELLVNPKAVTPHTNIFSMTKKNQFVTDNTVCVKVTPAQQKLLNLITPAESVDYHKALKTIHYLGTYCVENSMVELWQAGYVHQLLDAIQAISQEFIINNLKSS